MIRVITHGTPAPQGSKKSVGRNRFVEASKGLPAWRAAVEAAARLAAGPGWVPWDGPVSVSGTVSILKPGTTKFKDHPAGPPDLDKLQRGIGDALTKSRLITDDSRIVHWDIRKVWATGVPGADLVIREISGENSPT